MLSILISTAVAALIYFVLVKPFRYWQNQGVIQYKLTTIWWNSLLGFTPYRSLPETILKVYKDFSEYRYCGIYQFLRPALLVKDPDLIKQITVKDFDHFTDHNPIIPEDTEALWEKNLFALKGDKWREMRSTLSPSFTSSKMKVLFGLISDCAQQFVQYFEEQGMQTSVNEMKDVFTRFTNDVIATSAFGVTCNSLKARENEFYLMGRDIINFNGLSRIFSLLTIFIAPRISKILRLEFFSKRATNFFRKVIKENVEAREKNGIVRPDMIHLLMETRKIKNDQATKELDNENQEEKLNIEDITAQALIFFVAGFDTVSTVMCFLSYELAVNIDIQQRLQDEIDQTLNACEGTLTYEALLKMKYMDMVISESQRKWPSVGLGDRICVKPYTIEPVNDNEKPVHLKKGDLIMLPTFGLHRDPQYYPQPEKFDPERFNDENKSGINPYTFLPFGVGPRSCIGNRFALMEIKLVFFYILSKFDVVVVEKTTVPLRIAKSQFQLTSEGGFWLGLKPRNT